MLSQEKVIHFDDLAKIFSPVGKRKSIGCGCFVIDPALAHQIDPFACEIFHELKELLLDVARDNNLIPVALNSRGEPLPGAPWGYDLSVKHLLRPDVTGIGAICEPSGIAELVFNLEEMGTVGISVWNNLVSGQFDSDELLKFIFDGGYIQIPRHNLAIYDCPNEVRTLIDEKDALILPNGINVKGIRCLGGMNVARLPYSYYLNCDVKLSSSIVFEDELTGDSRIEIFPSRDPRVEHCLRKYQTKFAKEAVFPRITTAPPLDDKAKERMTTRYKSMPNAIKLKPTIRLYVQSIRDGIWIAGKPPSNVIIYVNERGRTFVVKSDLYEDYRLWCGNREVDKFKNFSEGVHLLTKSATTQIIDQGRGKKAAKVFFMDVILGNRDSSKPRSKRSEVRLEKESLDNIRGSKPKENGNVEIKCGSLVISVSNSSEGSSKWNRRTTPAEYLQEIKSGSWRIGDTEMRPLIYSIGKDKRSFVKEIDLTQDYLNWCFARRFLPTASDVQNMADIISRGCCSEISTPEHPEFRIRGIYLDSLLPGLGDVGLTTDDTQTLIEG